MPLPPPTGKAADEDRAAPPRLASMTVIDAHHHGWDLAVRDQDWITGARRPDAD